MHHEGGVYRSFGCGYSTSYVRDNDKFTLASHLGFVLLGSISPLCFCV